MKRLTIRNKDGRAGFAGSGSPTENTLRIPMMINRLAEYEDAEEQGLLVRLPCKVGSIIYRFQRYFDDATLTSKIKIKPCEVESVSVEGLITTDHVFLMSRDFGKTVFLTREAAERALEGMKNEA